MIMPKSHICSQHGWGKNYTIIEGDELEGNPQEILGSCSAMHAAFVSDVMESFKRSTALFGCAQALQVTLFLDSAGWES